MADTPVMDAPAPAPETAPVDPLTVKPGGDKAIVSHFKAQVAATRRLRAKMLPTWEINVMLRMGQPDYLVSAQTISLSDDAQTTINPDWSLTKTKTANLYSQVPTVQGTHENSQYAPAVPPFMKALNYELGPKRANVAASQEEKLNDAVNAAGVGVTLVGYTARFAEKEVPALDPSTVPPEMLAAMPEGLPMVKVPYQTDYRFFTRRIFPKDFLWPTEFLGSCFDEAAWVGHSGRMPWAQAKPEFKLTDAEKDRVLGDEQKSDIDRLKADPEHALSQPMVTFDEIFYWRYLVDETCQSFSEIWRMVFINGRDEPINEPWKGQKLDPQTGKYIGACKFPLRVLTLTYVSDNPIPPSDSAAGRPQVMDLQRSRSQMFMNRDRSRPIRWFDANRVDPEIRDNLLRGTWQSMIPTNGDGSRVIGEIARASYPSEDFSFDRAAKEDLRDSWQIGPDQLGSQQSGETPTAAQVKVNQGNFSTRIGQERAQVAADFLSTAEVLAGLMALYSDFPTLSPQERQQMESAWDRKHILHDLVLSIRPDSTVLLDAQTRVQRLMDMLNMLAKSGQIDTAPIIREIIELNGMDPAEILKPPAQPQPEHPRMAYSFSGKEDMNNPVVLAILIKAGMAPTPQEIQQAQQLLVGVVQPIQPPAPQPGPPAGPNGVETATPPPLEAHPDWQLASKVAQRSRDIRS